MRPQSEEEKIMLDSSSFKALASETRVLILKELDKKRCTASEIGKIMGISVQAASEHLENLRVAGLVERVDEGRKWIYFTLTEKGKAVLHPDKGKRLWILLSLFALMLAGAGFMIYNQPQHAASPSLQLPIIQTVEGAGFETQQFIESQKTAEASSSSDGQAAAASLPLNATNRTG
ncbi:MAG: winged helix-turn-helix domain-containing protein [Candidatus Norongarragalinales archaeon]